MQNKTALIFDADKLSEFYAKRTMVPLENPSQFFREFLRVQKGSVSSIELLQTNDYTVTEPGRGPEADLVRTFEV